MIIIDINQFFFNLDLTQEKIAEIGDITRRTIINALKRECLEEIGSSVEMIKLRFIREYIGKNHQFASEDSNVHQVELMFECRLINDKLKLTEDKDLIKIVEYYNGSVECYSNFSFRKNYTKKRPAKKKYGTKKHDTKHIYPDADKKRPKLDTTCKIIKNHHSDMKDDPERLTTDFILELINTKRNGENKK